MVLRFPLDEFKPGKGGQEVKAPGGAAKEVVKGD